MKDIKKKAAPCWHPPVGTAREIAAEMARALMGHRDVGYREPHGSVIDPLDQRAGGGVRRIRKSLEEE